MLYLKDCFIYGLRLPHFSLSLSLCLHHWSPQYPRHCMKNPPLIFLRHNPFNRPPVGIIGLIQIIVSALLFTLCL